MVQWCVVVFVVLDLLSFQFCELIGLSWALWRALLGDPPFGAWAVPGKTKVGVIAWESIVAS